MLTKSCYLQYYLALSLLLISIRGISQKSTSSFTITAATQTFADENILLEWSLSEMPLFKMDEKPESRKQAGVGQIAMTVANKPTDFSRGHVKIFPTVVTDFITLVVNSSGKAKVNFEITDISGKPLDKNTIQVNEMNVERKLYVRNLTKGLYFFHVQLINPKGESYKSVFKFIKL